MKKIIVSLIIMTVFATTHATAQNEEVIDTFYDLQDEALMLSWNMQETIESTNSQELAKLIEQLKSAREHHDTAEYSDTTKEIEEANKQLQNEIKDIRNQILTNKTLKTIFLAIEEKNGRYIH